MPKVPQAPGTMPQFTFREIFEFEAGLRELKLLNIDKQNLKNERTTEKAKERAEIFAQGSTDKDSSNYATYRIRKKDATATAELEHETLTTVFKAQYVFSKAEERAFCERQHLRQSLTYGH